MKVQLSPSKSPQVFVEGPTLAEEMKASLEKHRTIKGKINNSWVNEAKGTSKNLLSGMFGPQAVAAAQNRFKEDSAQLMGILGDLIPFVKGAFSSMISHAGAIGTKTEAHPRETIIIPGSQALSPTEAHIRDPAIGPTMIR